MLNKFYIFLSYFWRKNCMFHAVFWLARVSVTHEGKERER